MTFARGARTSALDQPDTQVRELAAALVPNAKRSVNECDLFGSTLIDGVAYRIRAWHRTDPGGREWIKLTLSRRVNP